MTPEQDASFLNFMAKAATAYAFRNGPVEDMHAAGQLSDADMKLLNKTMVDRLGEIFQLMHEGREEDLQDMLLFSYQCAEDWDDVDLSRLDQNIRIGKLWANMMHTA